jgi:uncharacterized membrane protein
MRLKTTYSLPEDRLDIIDLVKGIDIILMVLFNYSVTLNYFGFLHLPSDLFYQKILPMSIASVFIFMSGVSAYVSYQKDNENFSKKYFTRGLKLLFFAFLITLFTYIFVPQKTVFFGIIHFFAVSSFLIPFFIKRINLNMIASISIILAGFYLQQIEFSFSYLFWLGFVPENLSTFDYFPLIPWLGVLLLGTLSWKLIVGNTSKIEFRSRIYRGFVYMGKHSLTIYLFHQPVLVILLMALGLQIF